MAEIYLIRHGQASFGQANYDKLSELGREQSRLLGQFMQGPFKQGNRPTHLVCGALVRHQETLEGWLEGMGNDLNLPVIQNTAFNEFDHENVLEVAFPEFADKKVLTHHVMQSGDPKKAFHRLYEAAVDRWISGQHDQEYIESFSAFKTRCIEGIEGIVADAQSGQRYFIFTSGGPIGMCLKWAMQLTDQVAFSQNAMLVNSGVTKLVSNSAGECTVSYFNNYAHLQHESSLISYR